MKANCGRKTKSAAGRGIRGVFLSVCVDGCWFGFNASDKVDFMAPHSFSVSLWTIDMNSPAFGWGDESVSLTLNHLLEREKFVHI